jgi:acetylornithine deacetylase/succinyl-diaminopimelate desuccinylase-like protein
VVAILQSVREPAEVPGFARAHRRRFVAQLCDFLRFPSVSASPRSPAVRDCASWLAQHARSIGLEDVGIIETPGAPVVFAGWRHARPGKPTVLIYGHYDVQPPDPLDAWRSPPFEPAIRGDNLYARGASDDKGQLFTHLKACESWFRSNGRLPVNVKCIFEGEEEVGSTHFRGVLERNRTKLAADVAVISDTQIAGPLSPALTCSLRGTLSLELMVEGPRRDLHSGSFGGAVLNPIQALSEILCGLHDRAGRVNIPGFYDTVTPPSDLGCEGGKASAADFLQRAGVRSGWGETGFTLEERATARPALTINGIRGGYQGSGGKGIIPSSATAKLSFRLVPDQDPAEIDQLFREHVSRIAPRSVRVGVKTLAMSAPVVVSGQSPFLRAAVRAYERGFGTAPLMQRSGGTIPVVNLFGEVLGIPTLLMGFALPDDGAHGPNEKIHLPTFFRGIETSIHFLQAMEDVR